MPVGSKKSFLFLNAGQPLEIRFKKKPRAPGANRIYLRAYGVVESLPLEDCLPGANRWAVCYSIRTALSGCVAYMSCQQCSATWRAWPHAGQQS